MALKNGRLFPIPFDLMDVVLLIREHLLHHFTNGVGNERKVDVPALKHITEVVDDLFMFAWIFGEREDFVREFSYTGGNLNIGQRLIIGEFETCVNLTCQYLPP